MPEEFITTNELDDDEDYLSDFMLSFDEVEDVDSDCDCDCCCLNGDLSTEETKNKDSEMTVCK